MSIFTKIKKVFSNSEDKDYYLKGLNKSNSTFGAKIKKLAFGFSEVNEDFLEELMIILLEADIGVKTAEIIIKIVEEKAKTNKVTEFDELANILVETMAELYDEEEAKPIVFNESGTTVILMVGVNGSGKTTSTAKLVNYYKKKGMSVAVAAADTFRAGAMQQLDEWATRLDIHCIKGKENGDPSSVLVDACRYAKENKIDILIGDTAGRLQNKTNLMNELNKMKRVIEREIPGAPHQIFLVLDATTGQNGIAQASVFMDTTNVDGIILSKMDGTAKGGIVIAIKRMLGIPVKYIGLGETIDDLKEFDINTYLYGLCKGFLNETNTED
ncbi:MAG: signal recognition particle-docking protein FtsY [Erysipelotrichaceae bacterium]